jgi:Protein of unknown function (DUF3616)
MRDPVPSSAVLEFVFGDPRPHPPATKDLRRDLSYAAQNGRTLWTGSDETARVERLVTRDFRRFGERASFALADFFELPEGPDVEVDLEGIAMADGWLWVVGSHSRTRAKPKPGDGPAKTLRALKELIPRPNRCLLGRIPVTVEPNTGLPTLARKDAKRRAGALAMDRKGNALTRLLAKDKVLAPFLALPSKENGLDIEGIAARGDRVFLGLRGPVLRGWAVVLEIEVAGKAVLELADFGTKQAKYRRHFLDLAGRGIRDLAFTGSDLLILAGPTMDLDGPSTVYRWRGAARATEAEAIGRDRLERVIDLPYGDGVDRPEGLAVFRAPGAPERLLVLCDSPDPRRLGARGMIAVDLYDVPAPKPVRAKRKRG